MRPVLERFLILGIVFTLIGAIVKASNALLKTEFLAACFWIFVIAFLCLLVNIGYSYWNFSDHVDFEIDPDEDDFDK